MRADDFHSNPRWAVFWFATLIAATIIVRVVDPTGWLGSDDAGYYSAAEHVLVGEPIQRVHHHYARAPVVLAVASSVALFGHNAEAVALPTLVASVLCVALVVLLGSKLFGWWEGLFAGTVVAVLPYFRVLSTTAYPDVHVCLWTTAAMLLAVSASRRSDARRAIALWSACGFVAGIAISAKVFAIAVLPAVGFIAVGRPLRPVVDGAKLVGTPSTRGGATWRALAATFAGLVVFQMTEGLFYWWAADDFFFSLRATLSAQANVPGMAAESGTAAMTLTQFVTDRLAMLFHPSVSGWGLLGVLFWPTLVVAAYAKREARALVVWALATFVLIAFVPLNLKSGAQPYPIFHGRHILPSCIPFALCLGWWVRRAGEATIASTWVTRGWPAVAAGVVALSYVGANGLNGFRDRATSRVGEAIRQCTVNPPWSDQAEIFMTPSMYWRYRVLFPASTRERLRVTADESSPQWWKKVTFDIASRAKPLPPPGDAYLLATPAQLRGECEQWDYGVSLPHEAIRAWRDAPVLATLVRGADKRISRVDAGSTAANKILMLLGPTATDAQIAGVSPPPSDPPTIVR